MSLGMGGIFDVLDEAHCVLNWDSFRRYSEALGVVARLRRLGTVPVILLSATLRQQVFAELVGRYFRGDTCKIVRDTLQRPIELRRVVGEANYRE